MIAAHELLAHAQGRAFIADTGYDSNDFLHAVRQRGMKPVIHPQGGTLYKPRLNRTLYRIRYRVECFFHSLKRFRAIATRYEKFARNDLAPVQLACASLWLETRDAP